MIGEKFIWNGPPDRRSRYPSHGASSSSPLFFLLWYSYGRQVLASEGYLCNTCSVIECCTSPPSELTRWFWLYSLLMQGRERPGGRRCLSVPSKQQRTPRSISYPQDKSNSRRNIGVCVRFVHVHSSCNDSKCVTIHTGNLHIVHDNGGQWIEEISWIYLGIVGCVRSGQ